MTSHSRGLQLAPRNRALTWAIALAIGTAACGAAEAARLGHARVVSAPGAPMQVVVPLVDLAPEEAANLRIGLADAAAWQRAGLQPPTPLADTTVRVEAGPNAASRVVRIVSNQPPGGDAIDILLDLRSSAGQRQLQVTILVPPRGGAARVQGATVGQPAAPRSAALQQVQVRPGQALWGIAVRHGVADATLYQMLVALWQANPQAFIQNNMNLVRAGETLTIPDAATVRAIDPNEARRIFAEQAEAYARYRARLGAAAGGAAAPRGADGTSGRVEAGQSAAGTSPGTTQDRLRLSSATPGAGANGQSDAAADARVSENRAMADTRQRVDTLQSNVDALNKAAGESGAAGQQSTSGQGASGQGAGAGGVQAGAGGAQGSGDARGASGANATSTAAGPGAGIGAADAPAAGSQAAGTGTTAGSTGTASGSGAAAGQSAAPESGGTAPGNASPGGTGVETSDAGVSGGTASGGNAAGSNAAGGNAAGGAAGAGAAGTSPSAGSAATGRTAAGGAAGASDAKSGNGASASGSTVSGSTASGQAADGAAVQGKADNGKGKGSMPGWLADNLLAIVTAVLALIIFIVAWALRRAGARRSEDEESYDYGEATLDSAALNRKLDTINLDLDQPPSDEPASSRRT